MIMGCGGNRIRICHRNLRFFLRCLDLLDALQSYGFSSLSREALTVLVQERAIRKMVNVEK